MASCGCTSGVARTLAWKRPSLSSCGGIMNLVDLNRRSDSCCHSKHHHQQQQQRFLHADKNQPTSPSTMQSWKPPKAHMQMQYRFKSSSIKTRRGRKSDKATPSADTEDDTNEEVNHASNNNLTVSSASASVSQPSPEPDRTVRPMLLHPADSPSQPSSQSAASSSSSSSYNPMNEFAPRIIVIGVGGGGGNALNTMTASTMTGVDFLAINTDAQHLSTTLTPNRLQIGTQLTGGLGCGANPEAGRLAAEESQDEILAAVGDAHMAFIAAGMGGGTGTGAAPVVAELCYQAGILTVAVVTKPFVFEGRHRMRMAEEGLAKLQPVVDTLLTIPNQNLFQLVDAKTCSFVESFQLADEVLLAGVRGITDLMTVPGLINLDFADVQSVMHGMGHAILGTGQASGEDRAILAAEQALHNPLLGNLNVRTAKGMLVNITGGRDMTLQEVDLAAQRVTSVLEEESANIIFGSSLEEGLDGFMKVSVVATGIEEGGDEEEGEGGLHGGGGGTSSSQQQQPRY